MSLPSTLDWRSHYRRDTSRRWSPLQVASLVTLLACDEGTAPKPEITWEGTVSSAATGAPISGAQVGVGDGIRSGLILVFEISTTTNAQGHYSLTKRGCISNPYVQARAAGYDWNDKAVSCQAGVQTVDLALTPH